MFQHASCCQGTGVVPPALALAPQHAEVEVLVHASRLFPRGWKTHIASKQEIQCYGLVCAPKSGVSSANCRTKYRIHGS